MKRLRVGVLESWLRGSSSAPGWSSPPPRLICDATQAFERPHAADPLDLGCLAALSSAGDARVRLARLGPRGLISGLGFNTRSERQSTAVRALRDWIVSGAAPPQHAHAKPPRRRLDAERRQAAAFEPPLGAVYLKIGWRGWEDRRLKGLLLNRPDLDAVALMTRPWRLDYPEYASARDAAAAARAWESAHLYARVIEPAEIASRGAPAPSRLAGTRCVQLLESLADQPYFIQVGALEARSNTLLLLQLWREFAASGEPAPKLVLAGDFGAQADEIAPFLDWRKDLRRCVRVSGSLDPQSLRELILHARGVLAPDFANVDRDLLRDARALGTLTISSVEPSPGPQAAPALVLDPLAGRAWREAIGEASRAAPRRAPDVASLPDWSAFARALIAIFGR